MRILTFFVKITIILLLLSLGVFLLAREALLLSAEHMVKSSLSEMVLVSNKGSYAAACRAKGVSDFSLGSGPVLQLRFLSDQEYVVEVNCVANSIDPVLINQQKLPPFVTKGQGGSGFTLEPRRSAIQLDAFAELETVIDEIVFFKPTFISRSLSIAAEGGEIIIDDATPLDYENGPVTSCSGYGYFCCDAVAEQGVGDSITGLSGCEKSCFSQCVSRPLVLSFTTNPFFEFTSRSLAVRKGETIEFSYVADAGKGNSVTGTIEFGDGESESVSSDTGTVVHKYACAMAQCSYTARITLVDNWGVDSSDTEVSSIKITVQ